MWDFQFEAFVRAGIIILLFITLINSILIGLMFGMVQNIKYTLDNMFEKEDFEFEKDYDDEMDMEEGGWDIDSWGNPERKR